MEKVGIELPDRTQLGSARREVMQQRIDQADDIRAESTMLAHITAGGRSLTIEEQRARQQGEAISCRFPLGLRAPSLSFRPLDRSLPIFFFSSLPIFISPRFCSSLDKGETPPWRASPSPRWDLKILMIAVSHVEPTKLGNV